MCMCCGTHVGVSSLHHVEFRGKLWLSSLREMFLPIEPLFSPWINKQIHLLIKMATLNICIAKNCDTPIWKMEGWHK